MARYRITQQDPVVGRTETTFGPDKKAAVTRYARKIGSLGMIDRIQALGDSRYEIRGTSGQVRVVLVERQ